MKFIHFEPAPGTLRGINSTLSYQTTTTSWRLSMADNLETKISMCLPHPVNCMRRIISGADI